MKDDKWQNELVIAKLVFYMVLIGGPAMMVFFVAIIYLTVEWHDYYLVILLTIPADIIGAMLVLKPRIERSRYRIMRTYRRVPLDWILACVQNTLTENRIRYTVAEDYLRFVKPPKLSRVHFDAGQDGLGIDVYKVSAEVDTVRVTVEYKENTSGLMLNRIKEGIETRVVGGSMR